MPEDNHLPHILNLSNSIIGVTILAMPFCYKECGMVLGTILLFFCTWLTLSSCQMLMKAGLSSRKRSYGFLAYYTHGFPGKFAVEVGMIGLQMGTLVAQVVIIGDLGPAIISKFTGIENTSRLRSGLIILLCLGVGLPLGLLKNLSSISKASTLCICFYALFALYIVSLSVPNLISANWYSRVNLWKTDGLFKCLPIFSFAFGCQTQLFILYDSLVEPSLKGINSIISSAVNMCTCGYLLVGFFGYVSFCDMDITGDIINHLPSSIISDVLKLGFVMSIAITFPLIIFPCRSSLYTLLFPQRPKHNEDIEQRPVLPEIHFKVLTVIIVLTAVTTGIFVPNVEFVLALSGATMGTLICYIFPAMFFLRVMTGSSEGKNTAQFVFVCGFTIMLLCTYTTLNSQDKGHVDIKPAEIMAPTTLPALPILKKEDSTLKLLFGDKGTKDALKESRIEPPNPREPVENKSENEKIAEKELMNIKGQDAEIIKQTGDTGIKIGKRNTEEESNIPGDKRIVKDKEEEKKKENLDKQNEILNELKKQHEEQQKLIDEQKKILAELKEHQEEKHKLEIMQKPEQNLKGEGVEMVAKKLPLEGQHLLPQQQPAAGQQQLPQQPAAGQQQLPQQQPAANQQKIFEQLPGANQLQLPGQQSAAGQKKEQLKDGGNSIINKPVLQSENQVKVALKENMKNLGVENPVLKEENKNLNKDNVNKVVVKNDADLMFKRDINSLIKAESKEIIASDLHLDTKKNVIKDSNMPEKKDGKIGNVENSKQNDDKTKNKQIDKESKNNANDEMKRKLLSDDKKLTELLIQSR